MSDYEFDDGVYADDLLDAEPAFDYVPEPEEATLVDNLLQPPTYEEREAERAEQALAYDQEQAADELRWAQEFADARDLIAAQARAAGVGTLDVDQALALMQEQWENMLRARLAAGETHDEIAADLEGGQAARKLLDATLEAYRRAGVSDRITQGGIAPETERLLKAAGHTSTYQPRVGSQRAFVRELGLER